MKSNVFFHEEDRKELSFKRISPKEFHKSISRFLDSLPTKKDKRAAAILEMLRKNDCCMVSALFNLLPIPEEKIKSYRFHEGDPVLSAMARRFLAQAFVTTKGMAHTVDSTEFRRAIDSADLAARVQNFGYYMRETWKMKKEELRTVFQSRLDASRIKRIVLPGAMGGSASGAQIVKMLLTNFGFKTDLSLLPHYPSDKYPLLPRDLAVIYSYSGNTEEALLWLERKGAIPSDVQIIGLSIGGRLEEICRKKNYLFIEIPGKTFGLVQPREHLAVSIVLLLGIIGYSGMAWKPGRLDIFNIEKWWPTIEAISLKLTELSNTTYNVDLPFSKNIAKQAALFLNWGTTDPRKVKDIATVRDPVLWASTFYEPIARRLEDQFGECVEHPASAKIMPEDLHNEQEAYVEQWMEYVWGIESSPFRNVFLRFKGPMDERLGIRADKVFEDFLKGAPRMDFIIKDYGPDFPMLGELEALLFCDLVRAFASIFRGVTPHFVHSMNYNKHYMGTIEGGPGISGGF